jgi:hypothetical protein
LIFLPKTIGLSVDKYFNRSNSPLHLQDRMELALQIYNTANRSSFDKVTFQLELDACLRWCSLLREQNDVKVDTLFYIDCFFILFNRNIEMISINISPG